VKFSFPVTRLMPYWPLSLPNQSPDFMDNSWVENVIMKTLASACLLLEIRWQKGRQADKMRTCLLNPQ